MDEVSIIVELLTGTDAGQSSSRWSRARDALSLDGTITTPTVIDVRTLQPNKGSRYDMSNSGGGATILVFEDSQNITYPTIHYDIRNETYSLTLHLRVIHDERANGNLNYGRDRLRDLYAILRKVIEDNRRGFTASDGSKFNQMFIGSRTESNDRGKKLYGYKVSLELKRFGLSIPQ